MPNHMRLSNSYNNREKYWKIPNHEETAKRWCIPQRPSCNLPNAVISLNVNWTFEVLILCFVTPNCFFLQSWVDDWRLPKDKDKWLSCSDEQLYQRWQDMADDICWKIKKCWLKVISLSECADQGGPSWIKKEELNGFWYCFICVFKKEIWDGE